LEIGLKDKLKAKDHITIIKVWFIMANGIKTRCMGEVKRNGLMELLLLEYSKMGRKCKENLFGQMEICIKELSSKTSSVVLVNLHGMMGDIIKENGKRI